MEPHSARGRGGAAAWIRRLSASADLRGLLPLALPLVLAACGDVDPGPELELEHGTVEPDVAAPAVELVALEAPTTMRAALSANAVEEQPGETHATPKLSAQLQVIAREDGQRVGAGMRISVGLGSYHGRTWRAVSGSERELVVGEQGRASIELDDRLPEGAGARDA